MPILGGRLKSPVLHGENRMIGEVKITRLHYMEVACVAAFIDRKALRSLVVPSAGW